MISEIRERIADRLQTHPDLNGRVYIERTRQLSQIELPCVDISFVDAASDYSVLGQVGWEGRFTVTVKVCAPEPYVPAMKDDRLARIVRGLLYTDETLSGLLPDALKINALRTEFDAEGDLIMRAMVIELTANWIEPLGTDPGVLADLLTIHVDIDMASPRNDPPLPICPDGQIDARATIQLPQ